MYRHLSGIFCVLPIHKRIPIFKRSIFGGKWRKLHITGTHFSQVTQVAKPLEAVGGFKLQLLP